MEASCRNTAFEGATNRIEVGGDATLRKRDDSQSLSTRGPRETIVECCERDALASFALQVQAAGELYSVARAQAVPDEQYLSVGCQLRCEFHENPGGKVGVQPFQRPIALSRGERSFAFAAGKRRGDFDGR